MTGEPANVFVLGNAGIDFALTLPRLARPGETVVASASARAPGGKGLNQAVVAARAGARVHFRAPVGDDPEAAFVAEALAREPLEHQLLRKTAPTDHSIVMVSDDGENSIVSLGGCADALREDEASAFAGLTTANDWLLMQGNLTEAATLAAAKAARGRVALNAAPLRWPLASLLPRCELLIVNRIEAEEFSGGLAPREAALHARAHGCEIAIVTLGGEGCLWAEADGVHSSPAPLVHPVDTTGAGDTFCGVLIARLAAGVPLRPSIAAAQAAAALCVTRAGAFAALPTVAELR